MTFPTFAATTLAAFAAASLVLSVTPGPGVLYVVTRTLAQGRRAGLASVAGVALGNFGNAVGASIGLAALFAVSALAFTIVKWAGAGYLLWLGIQALRSPRATTDALRFDAPRSGDLPRRLPGRAAEPEDRAVLRRVPAPVHRPAGSAIAQSVALGALFVAIAASTDAAT
jgi:threonine/homoserine/homoserine lactone efflux protein